jgi:hypothetical protein
MEKCTQIRLEIQTNLHIPFDGRNFPSVTSRAECIPASALRYLVVAIYTSSSLRVIMPGECTSRIVVLNINS